MMKAIIDAQVWKYGHPNDFRLHDEEDDVHFYFQSTRDFEDSPESVALVIKDIIELMGSESDYQYNHDPKYVSYRAKRTKRFCAKRGSGNTYFELKLFPEFKHSTVQYLIREKIEVPLGSSDEEIAEIVAKVFPRN